MTKNKKKSDGYNDRKRQKKNNRKREDPRESREREDTRSRKGYMSAYMKDYRSSYSHLVKTYEESIKLGADQICSSCGGLFFLNGIKVTDREELVESFEENFIQAILQRDEGLEDIQFCVTCHKDIWMSKVPRLCLSNGLAFPSIPPVLAGLSELEERMVAPRLPFMKIVELRVGKQYGLKGNVVNVPIEIKKSVDILPRAFDKMDVIQLKLKRMTVHKSTYLESFISPSKVFQAAKHLCGKALYRDEGVHLSIDWSTFHNQDKEAFVVDPKDNEEDSEIIPQLLDENWDETVDDLSLNVGDEQTLLKQGLIFAPGEGETPISLLFDENVEELSFPTIYCGEKRVFKVKLSYNDIVHSELRRFDRRACKVTKIFFMYRMKELIMLRNAVNICVRMSSSVTGVTAQQLKDKTYIQELINSDAAYKVLKGDRSSPVYWQARMKDLMAMIRQLGIPTFFLTLSAAETHWSELLIILANVLHKKVLTPEEALGLSFQDKCDLIRKDPVTCSRYFDHRIRQLFKLLQAKNGIFKDHPIMDFYYRIEFQHRGSPHLHSLLWLKDAPEYNPDQPSSQGLAEEFIDKYITSSGSNDVQELKRYQFHKHSQSCKRRLVDTFICRFGIPYFPMRRTLILEPLPEEQLTDEEFDSFPGYMDIIQDVIKAIDESQKSNIDSKCEAITFDDFLREVGLPEEDYINVIRNSLKRDQVFLRREPKDIRVNGFNEDILLRHRANMDLQYILNPYTCVHYILNYINKSNRGMSALLKEVINEHKAGNLTHAQKLYKICSHFINCSEVSAPEAVYILLSLRLSNSTRSVIFINTGPKEERVKILKSLKDIDNLEGESTDVMESGLIEHYTSRPDELNDICLAIFASKYNYSKTKRIKKSEDDESLSKEKSLKLKDCNGYVVERTKFKIIRYRKYQLENDPYNYYREKIMLYIPWRDEEKDILSNDCQDLYMNNIQAIRQIEALFIHKLAENLDEIKDRVESDVRQEYLDAGEENNAPDFCVFDLQENNIEVQDQFVAKNENPTCGSFSSPTVMREDNYGQLVRQLNQRQRDFLLGLLNHVKTSSAPFLFYLSGGAGSGKSCLIHAIYQTLVRWYKNEGTPEDIKVLLTAPTGKAAFNIHGTTIHSALGLSVTQNNVMKALSADKKNTLRKKLWYLKVVIIDEVSLVGAQTLRKIDQKLREIFERNDHFGGISILFVGDLNQIRPVQDRYVFEAPKSTDYALLSGTLLWSQVKYFELTEIMRQKDDKIFADSLNRLSTGNLISEDRVLFSSRLVDKDDVRIPSDAIRLFPTNHQVDAYNQKAFALNPGADYTSEAHDYPTEKLSRNALSQALFSVGQMKAQKTYGLPKTIGIKVGMRYMITTNLDIEDGLVNGTTGILCHIDHTIKSGKDFVELLWFDFNDASVGRKARTKFRSNIQNNIVLTPIARVDRGIQTKSEDKFVLINRKQFPVVIAEAMTIHKAQGQTYDRVVIDLGKKLELAMMYTAFSRARTLDGLFLTGSEIRFPNTRSETHPVSMEISRLRATSAVDFNIRFEHTITRTDSTILMFYQNLPYLVNKVEDICADHNIMASDMMFFVETHSRNVEIPGYNLRHQIPASERVYGISIYAKQSTEWLCTQVKEEIRYHSEAHLEAIIVTSDIRHIQWIVIYISPKFPKVQAIQEILTIIGSNSLPDYEIIVLGDFNIDANSTHGQNLELELNRRGLYTCIPNDKPSTDFGSRIDWIYTNNILPDAHIYESLVSDHKPFFMCVSDEFQLLELF